MTAGALAELGRGALVLQHDGSPDAPWQVSWEFRHGDVPCRWTLSDYGGHASIVAGQPQDAPPGEGSAYTQLWEAFFGPPASVTSGSDLPPLPQFTLGLLCRPGGRPVETLQVQANGGRLDPELAPHRSFADLAEIPLWTQQPNRVYSLAWVLRRVFQRGLVVIGEQFRGVGTMAAPLRPAGREVDLSLQVSVPGGQEAAGGDNGEAVVTVLGDQPGQRGRYRLGAAGPAVRSRHVGGARARRGPCHRTRPGNRA